MSEVGDTRPVQVVIGATGGIGSATARLLRAAGAEVVLAGRNKAGLQALAEEIGGAPLEVDATDPNAVEKALQDATQGPTPRQRAPVRERPAGRAPEHAVMSPGVDVSICALRNRSGVRE